MWSLRDRVRFQQALRHHRFGWMFWCVQDGSRRIPPSISGPRAQDQAHSSTRSASSWSGCFRWRAVFIRAHGPLSKLDRIGIRHARSRSWPAPELNCVPGLNRCSVCTSVVLGFYPMLLRPGAVRCTWPRSCVTSCVWDDEPFELDEYCGVSQKRRQQFAHRNGCLRTSRRIGHSQNRVRLRRSARQLHRGHRPSAELRSPCIPYDGKARPPAVQARPLGTAVPCGRS